MHESGVANTTCRHVGMSACRHVSFACLLESNPTYFDKELKDRVAGADILGNMQAMVQRRRLALMTPASSSGPLLDACPRGVTTTSMPA